MNYRILLQLPGEELCLFKYRAPVPITLALKKAATLASGVFKSWEWAPDGDIPAILNHEGRTMILVVAGPDGGGPWL